MKKICTILLLAAFAALAVDEALVEKLQDPEKWAAEAIVYGSSKAGVEKFIEAGAAALAKMDQGDVITVAQVLFKANSCFEVRKTNDGKYIVIFIEADKVSTVPMAEDIELKTETVTKGIGSVSKSASRD